MPESTNIEEAQNIFSIYYGAEPPKEASELIRKVIEFTNAAIEFDDEYIPEIYIDGPDFVKFHDNGWSDSDLDSDEISDAFDCGFNGESNRFEKVTDKYRREYLVDAYSWGKHSAKILKQFGLTQADFN